LPIHGRTNFHDTDDTISIEIGKEFVSYEKDSIRSGLVSRKGAIGSILGTRTRAKPEVNDSLFPL